MVILKQILLLGTLAISAYSQGYANLVYGQYLHHSENDEPTSWTKPIAYVWSGDAGYEFRLRGSSLVQVGLGFEENYNPKYGKHTFDPDLGERVQYNLEQSIPFYIRMFWSSKGMTGYGVGPIYSPVKQTFVLDYSGLSYHREVVYTHALGVSGIARLSRQLSQKLYGLLSLEVRYQKGLWFQGGGQDLSNYSWDNSQIRLSLGLGWKNGSRLRGY
ncbi:MAG: hypothetical protein HOB84_08495 [Candidatus Marinimicrobia bacterium]|jgi:hypothetical protein|nr:hypothetical protein [Candidatus Neomarinimicrobiota bacterium]MBT4035248.1 hypothetical protein [Candidatus Neomarinimicrobiota bacterium]MBT4360416.1 hypothetical protein [Candidatus Neomarinimicrobiota bacterium]MBT4714797.1 hypothetical protein [Candidatus Neomarinimicrobiota bacterium]MBT4994190.1 hypothetical protein [Candidatus Neomarinimicrobiota bacterium]